MSKVTDVILITALYDGDECGEGHPNVDLLNAYLMREGYNQTLFKVDDHAGGGKCMGVDVFMAGLNKINHDEFIRAFQSISWQHPEQVQLMTKPEDNDTFKIFQPNRPNRSPWILP